MYGHTSIVAYNGVGQVIIMIIIKNNNNNDNNNDNNNNDDSYNSTVKPVLKATCIKQSPAIKATISDLIKGNEVEIYLY